MPLGNLPGLPAGEDPPEWVRRELGPILDHEISRLPEKHRQVFVLCHLDGCINEQAAARLGCPLGTVLTRLARARERLRHRLARRGLALSVALSAALAEEAAAATVPPVLTQTTLQAAAAFAGGSGTAGVVSSSVAALSEEILASVASARTVRIAAGLAVVALAALVLLLLLQRPKPKSAPVAASQPVLPAAIQQLGIQGVWRVISMEAEAGVLQDPGLFMVFEGNQCTLGAATARFLVDETPLPHEITMFPKQGGTWPGIYELKGEYLRICVNHGGLQRPTTFPDRAEGTVCLYELRREAAAPQPGGPGPGR